MEDVVRHGALRVAAPPRGFHALTSYAGGQVSSHWCGQSGLGSGQPMLKEPGRKYVSYLLRLWQVHDEYGLSWRASLEETRTGQRRGFIGLEALVDFLRGLAEPSEPHTQREESER